MTDNVIDLGRHYRHAHNIQTEEELAAMLRVEVSTLQTWRGKGEGPAHIKLGKSVYYRADDIEKWIADAPAIGAKAA